MPIVNSLPFETYANIERLSASGLKLLSKSPAHFKYSQPPKDTDALRLGRAIHAINLECAWGAVVVEPQINKRTKDGRAEYAAFLAENTGKTVVTVSEMEMVQGMFEALRKHETARSFLKLADSFESSLFWEEGGIECKARADVLCKKIPIIGEYKTTLDASAYGFGKSVTAYNYWIAVSHYLAGAISELSEKTQYLFIVQEKIPPYLVAVYRPDEDFISRANERRKRLLDLYAECTAKNEWPGYPGGIESIKLAEWI